MKGIRRNLKYNILLLIYKGTFLGHLNIMNLGGWCLDVCNNRIILYLIPFHSFKPEGIDCNSMTVAREVYQIKKGQTQRKSLI